MICNTHSHNTNIDFWYVWNCCNLLLSPARLFTFNLFKFFFPAFFFQHSQLAMTIVCHCLQITTSKWVVGVTPIWIERKLQRIRLELFAWHNWPRCSNLQCAMRIRSPVDDSHILENGTAMHFFAQEGHDQCFF